jgi:pimeloyl-ACP methyl ester carboxylesterase
MLLWLHGGPGGPERPLFRYFNSELERSLLVAYLDQAQRAMYAELLGVDMRKEVSAVDVPLFFFLGRYDRHIDAELAASYFEALRAPKKVLNWFERSAHNLPFDEPGLFNARIVQAIQSIEHGSAQ